ncbi:hypothetical protein C7999DRAFT_45067 [Corynascus novoguineensis]|uniref:Gylcosyl hydrolase 115 C-terminal domain-containing protein n=1 Tax=Corynascus novoguineensis TaxID=1126955 RepID=A0AAN7CJ34_9PEZI|nr:hypothetical protein C7999DRAFT_45067 [Corynascus novoguineensis]
MPSLYDRVKSLFHITKASGVTTTYNNLTVPTIIVTPPTEDASGGQSDRVRHIEERFVTFEPGSTVLSYLGISITNVPILIAEDDFVGVHIAARSLANDLAAITGVSRTQPTRNVVIVAGSVNSSLVRALSAEGHLDTSAIEGKWETFQTTVVNLPAPSSGHALVIVGSDKRGTIFGIHTLAEQCGQSPWQWFADVPAQKHAQIFALNKTTIHGEPTDHQVPGAIRYPLDTEFYAHVFDLLLRLKANFLWPTMWSSFTPSPGNISVTDDPRNQQLADDYGIVISMSHHEPMQRATNEFMDKGVARAGKNKSYFIIGMRGLGDEATDTDNAIKRLEDMFKVQRGLIKKYYGSETAVPQLPTKNETKRKGGLGVYFHFEYVGLLWSYKWHNSNNLAKANRIWIMNVGDPKPIELPLSIRRYEHLPPDTYSTVNFHEAERVRARWQALAARVHDLTSLIDPSLRPTFSQLVSEPVASGATFHVVTINTAFNYCYALAVYDAVKKPKQWANPARDIVANLSYAESVDTSMPTTEEHAPVLPQLSPYGPPIRHIEVSIRGDHRDLPDKRLNVTIDWPSVPRDVNTTLLVGIRSTPARYPYFDQIRIPVLNARVPETFSGFPESAGYIDADAEPVSFLHIPYPDTRSESGSIALRPFRAARASSAPPGGRMEFSLTLGDAPANFTRLLGDYVDVPSAGAMPPEWLGQVADQVWTRTVRLGPVDPGAHDLVWRTNSPEVYLEKIVVDCAGDGVAGKSYLGPPETRRVYST